MFSTINKQKPLGGRLLRNGEFELPVLIPWGFAPLWREPRLGVAVRSRLFSEARPVGEGPGQEGRALYVNA